MVVYPDGSLTLDRCYRHNTSVMRLKDEKGAWTQVTPGGKAQFKVSTPQDIEKQRKKK